MRFKYPSMSSFAFATALSMAATFGSATAGEPETPERIPLIHTSDLIHPPWDVDDQVDLACAYALEELDLRAVIIDFPQKADDKDHFEPAFSMITQLNWLTGRWVPAAVSPPARLQSPDDDGSHYSYQEQTGIRLLLDQLEKAEQPVYISVLGSSRTVTAALNRNPELVRKKVRAILLVAGVVYRDEGDRLDANSAFDREAFIGLMRSGLPIRWYPPGPVRPTSQPSEQQYAEAITHHCKFITPYDKLFGGLAKPLRSWFIFGFTGNQRGDVIRALYENSWGCTWWGIVSKAESACSSPAALLMAADRRLARTSAGWRFLPARKVPANAEEFTWSLTPVKLTIDDAAHTTWEKVAESHIQLFTHPPVDGINQDGLYARAMTEALNALFREELMPSDDPQ